MPFGSDSIEDKIDALLGGGSNNGGQQTSSTTDDTTEDGGSAATTQQDDGTGGSQSSHDQSGGGQDVAGGQGNANAQQQQQQTQPVGKQQGQQGQPPNKQQPNANANKRNPGDIIDSSGRVLARAGNERRLWEQNQRSTREVSRLSNEVKTLTTQLNTFREAAQLPTQLNLKPEDVTTAMHFMAHFRRDPVGALNEAIAQVRAAGMNLDGLGGTAVDMQAMQQMINKAVDPFKQDRQQQEQQQQVQSAVDKEINEAFEEYPWAEQNAPVIQAIMDRYPNDTLRMSIVRVEAYANANGLDLYQPLGPQVQALEARKQASTPTRVNNAMGQGANAPAAQTRQAPVSINRSNRDIVKDAMRSAGIDIE